MCGIAAYVGENAASKVFNSLKQMQYRGYDSWGLVGSHRIRGRMFQRYGLNLLPKDPPISGPLDMCVGHIRWASTGAVSFKNAHPINIDDQFWIAHNGQIKGNIPVKYDTDTEYFGYLILSYYNKLPHIDFIDAIRMALKDVGEVGAFVIQFNRKIYYYCDVLPLYTNGSHIVSDLLGLAGETSQAYKATPYTIYKINQHGNHEEGNFQQTKIVKVPDKVDNSSSMIKEIQEQKDTTCKQFYVPDDILKDERIQIVGCGSSYYAACEGAYLMRLYGYDATAVYATEFIPVPKAHVIFISQSGETFDVIDASRKVLTNNRVTIIQNKENSTLSSNFSNVLNMNVGVERAVGATKTFSRTVFMLLNMIYDDEPINVRYINSEIEQGLDSQEPQLLSHDLVKYNHILVLSSVKKWSLAQEIALKIKEVSNIHAEAVMCDEVKHGPLALIDDDTASLLLHDVHEVENHIRARGGKVFKLTGSWWECLVKGQLLSFYMAKLKGLNPDLPRNLAKTVTV